MFKLFQNVLRLLGKLSITPVTLFTPTAVLFEDLGLCVDVPRYHVVVNGLQIVPHREQHRSRIEQGHVQELLKASQAISIHSGKFKHFVLKYPG